MPAIQLVLASASPRRAQVLRDAGFVFHVISSALDETPFAGESPQDLVRRLAESKAQLVAQRTIGPALIIAADTLVAADSKLLGKPRDAGEAREMLRQLSGGTHSVHTGLAVVRLPDQALHVELETTQVSFAPLSDQEIGAYISTGEPFDKAGAYAVQGRGGRYVTRIAGCYFNVVGLPLARLYRILGEMGWREQ
ncbi:MAG TPA: Maf family protein [Candidatus Dormibacteraeota bacterium]|nr:Maf family protein [Candidatus Dormibacteraeota bacterium]